MSNLDSELKKIQLPITDLGYQVICYHSINKRELECIVMIPLTEKEESLLDKGFLQTTRNDQEFNIYNNKERVDILCYGEIDLSDGSDDYNVIDGMNFLSHLSSVGLAIPSNYDYNEHCCYSINKKPMYYDTTSPALLAQYYHARLGKPKRCCIFKEKIYDTRRAVV